MAVVEAMIGGMKRNNMNPFLTMVLLIVVLLIMMQIGVYLWNRVLVRLIPFIKPVKNLWEVLAISILAKIIIF